jgi:hypothetical protein
MALVGYEIERQRITEQISPDNIKDILLVQEATRRAFTHSSPLV